jgi:PHD/YefM family antitoxin component YafN of YafNO toxin-antitoxin module
MLNPNVQYLVDDSGKKTAVLISIEEWQSLVEQLERYRQQEELKRQISAGLKDVRKMKKGEKKLMTLKEFLDKKPSHLFA